MYFKNKVLYAPSDFENETNYLAVNDIKQSVSSELEMIFAQLNASGEKISQKDIDVVKGNIEKSIERSAPTTRKEQILEYLEKGEALTTNISNDLGIHPSYTRGLLRKLNEEGVVNRYEKKDIQGVFWSLKST